MNITSGSFLFLFLPACAGSYHLLLRRCNITTRNAFLLLASLGFYAWGEPVRILLLILMILATHLLGAGAARHARTPAGKRYVLFAVLMNVGALALYKYVDMLLGTLGYILGRELLSLGLALPLGLSYFCFSSISYVVDLYRGKHAPQSLPGTALYLSAFFKITAGPIAAYGDFEGALREREVSRDDLAEGAWRFMIGFCKKAILALNLAHVSRAALEAGAELSASLAWLGAFAYLLQLYFDFSGYSDMAIGLGCMFGFRVPENFNYPYIARSVSEYWRRWHMTLGAWFRDYMYYPLTLGPAVRLRKRLLKHFDRNVSRVIQSLLVLSLIWSTTGLWHGARWNCVLWGLINGLFVFAEGLRTREPKPFWGWLYTFGLSLLVKPLAATGTLGQAARYYGAMMGMGAPGREYTFFLLREYGVFLAAGMLCAAPSGKWLLARIEEKASPRLTRLVRGVVLCALLLLFFLALSYGISYAVPEFIYGKY
jgi:D-alanyl-lipoteichoic acid acyltransferase DltB (MBOAT superfamily)